jgi:hypothetical protein
LVGLLALAACSSSSATPVSVAGPQNQDQGSFAGKDAGIAAAATAAPVAAVPANSSAPLLNDQSLIIKTGQLDLQVSAPAAAEAQATGFVTAAGGYVAGSSRSGDADTLVLSDTYRIPVAHWDATLAALHGASGGGTIKILDEQIQTQDVTAQAVDLDARLANLRATESALLGIMARATTITDTLAVEDQLSTVQGQIEELTAQRNTLGDQAAYSTLTVQFEATPATATTSATSGWNLGGTIDDAVAALVKISQGLAVAIVWALIVGGPIAVGLLILFLVYRLFRRIRPRRPKAPKILIDPGAPHPGELP